MSFNWYKLFSTASFECNYFQNVKHLGTVRRLLRDLKKEIIFDMIATGNTWHVTSKRKSYLWRGMWKTITYQPQRGHDKSNWKIRGHVIAVAVHSSDITFKVNISQISGHQNISWNIYSRSQHKNGERANDEESPCHAHAPNSRKMRMFWESSFHPILNVINQKDIFLMMVSIKWKHFPRYWFFVRWIHRSPMDSPHKGQWAWALFFIWYAPEKNSFSKQSKCRWFETRLLWRYCNGERIFSYQLIAKPGRNITVTS